MRKFNSQIVGLLTDPKQYSFGELVGFINEKQVTITRIKKHGGFVYRYYYGNPSVVYNYPPMGLDRLIRYLSKKR